MVLIDQNIFPILVFAPMVASIFLTLIPINDINSKRTVSKFFALIICLAFLRLVITLIDKKFSLTYSFSLDFPVEIAFELNANKHNIFLYGTTSLVLLLNAFLSNAFFLKTRIHQFSPFLLVFLLHIAFGQSKLDMMLPLLSLGNFLFYYLIAYSDESRRGTTIFQMGTFLIAIDTLALILMRSPAIGDDSGLWALSKSLIMLAPGLARLSLPMFAPHMKKLVLNLDPGEGPLLMIFLQLSGMAILLNVRQGMVEVSLTLAFIIAFLSLIGAIYLTSLLIETRGRLHRYFYILVFYSSVASAILFIAAHESLVFWSLSLFLVNIFCFHGVSSIATIFEGHRRRHIFFAKLLSAEFLTSALLIGVPGFGIGMSLWAALYGMLTLGVFGRSNIFPLIGILFGLAFLLLSVAFIRDIRDNRYRRGELSLTVIDRFSNRRQLILVPAVMAVISWLIPATIFLIISMGISDQ